MKKNLVTRLSETFEGCAHSEDGTEFWFARDLQKLLEYAQWRNFERVIEKAKISCKNSGVDVEDHFADASKMVAVGKGAEREVSDIKLTRYACYLIAQNGDSRKTEIAFAQTYFAVQARKQEVIEKRMKELVRLRKREQLAEREKRLAGIIFERGVDGRGFAKIKSKGDHALFGGNSTKQMKSKLNVPAKRPLADFLPAVTLTAKALADEITEHNVLEKDLQGEARIASENVASNKAIRRALTERNIAPEKLPPAEDIKQVKSRLSAEGKKLSKQATLTKGDG